jgi:hypothetical protein
MQQRAPAEEVTHTKETNTSHPQRHQQLLSRACVSGLL